MKIIVAVLAFLLLYAVGFVVLTQQEPQRVQAQSAAGKTNPADDCKPPSCADVDDSIPVRFCMLDGDYVSCDKVPLPWKGYVAKANDTIRWDTKTLSCVIAPDNVGASEEICDTKGYDDTDPEMFKTYGEPPFDVPPVVVRSQTYTLEDLARGVFPGYETCADKTRFLLHSEDGKGHCLRLGK